jgi:Cupin superfamily protein
MSVTSTKPLTVDGLEFAGAFGNRPLAVEHALVEHPLLRLEAIAELADRYPGRIERHQANQSLVTPGGAPDLEGPRSETVLGIDHNGCWMVFWYIDQVPEYRALLDECLDGAQAYLPQSVGPMIQREAFLFLSAPDAVTPVHFDAEHNFLLQIRGTKTMNVCPFPSRELELAELDRYHDGGHRNLESLPSEGEPFVLDPGQGVYVPTFMPHWVQNGPAASISLSVTFRTRASRRAERIYWTNARLRRLGLRPLPPAQSEARDRAKEALWLTGHGLQQGAGAIRRARAGARNGTASSD